MYKWVLPDFVSLSKLQASIDAIWCSHRTAYFTADMVPGRLTLMFGNDQDIGQPVRAVARAVVENGKLKLTMVEK